MNLLCLLQARMTSKRLPQKVLRPIMGRPMMGLLIVRIDDLEKARQVFKGLYGT